MKKTKKEIFHKILEKAEDDKKSYICFVSWLDYHNEEDFKYNKHYPIIFSPEFAKAYWGEKYTRCGSCLSKIYDYEITHCTNPKCNIPLLPEYTDEMYGWREHQHQMLTEVQEGKCPLKYLEKFL